MTGQERQQKQDWEALGGKNIWLPYTQMKTARTPLLAMSTQGNRITLADGRELVDGIASWWTACHGYNHPHILGAMQAQLQRMPHVMFGGLNHEPALRLAQRLSAMVPGNLPRVFFSDSGSVAVEVALKMAVQFWLNRGVRGRTRFLHFTHGYHGDTAACMGICDPDEGMHVHLKGYLPENIVSPVPQNEADVVALDALMETEKHQIAALIIEPLVQGAGGMRFHSAEILRGIHALCRKHGILFIADEIMTGFGRTGAMFACEEVGVSPDILCLGKALTGGVMTLAATLASTEIFETFWDDAPEKALMHGPTYMANPLACAAANASLDIFEQEPRLKQVAQLSVWMEKGLLPCRAIKGVVDVRVKGAIGVVQVKNLYDAAWLKARFVEEGVWVRPYRDIIYLAPAFTISEEETAMLTRAIVKVAQEWSRRFSV